MRPFLNTANLVLTPLAPIHVGTGEDFEPTNYVIHDNMLHAFDLSRVRLSPERRRELLQLANEANLGRIHAFLRSNQAEFLSASHIHIPVSGGVSKKYLDSLGNAVQVESDGKTVFNRNSIQRAMFCAADGLPYLPGSGVKGAMRTAWIEALHKNDSQSKPEGTRNREVAEWEASMLRGNFQTSPLRLLKLADFMPDRPEIDRRIVFACNFKKQPVSFQGRRNIKGRGPVTRVEVILPGQYRAFRSEVVVLDPGKRVHPGMSPLRPHLADLARYSNSYSLSRFEKEVSLIRENGYGDENWLRRLEQLLADIRDRLQSNKAFLIRLGRYGGAETKTIAALAQISIMGTSRIESEATTFWLAAEQDDIKSGMLPFGWALIEIDPQEDCAFLRAWCEQERTGRPDMQMVREKMSKDREHTHAEEADKAIADAEPQPAVVMEEQAEEQAELELAAMSPEERLLREFCSKLKAHPRLRPSDAGALILSECEAFLEQTNNWSDAMKKQCAELLAPILDEKNMFIGKKEKIFRAALRHLLGV